MERNLLYPISNFAVANNVVPGFQRLWIPEDYRIIIKKPSVGLSTYQNYLDLNHSLYLTFLVVLPCHKTLSVPFWHITWTVKQLILTETFPMNSPWVSSLFLFVFRQRATAQTRSDHSKCWANTKRSSHAVLEVPKVKGRAPDAF